ncbi:MAG: hypothetical protein V5A79_07195 [Candidatus Bipolaricaulota bacterium]
MLVWGNTRRGQDYQPLTYLITMANIISKDNLDEKVRTFLENLKDTTNEKYLIVQFKDEKIVVSSLSGWLKEEE